MITGSHIRYVCVGGSFCLFVFVSLDVFGTG